MTRVALLASQELTASPRSMGRIAMLSFGRGTFGSAARKTSSFGCCLGCKHFVIGARLRASLSFRSFAALGTLPKFAFALATFAGCGFATFCKLVWSFYSGPVGNAVKHRLILFSVVSIHCDSKLYVSRMASKPPKPNKNVSLFAFLLHSDDVEA
jgi:hypothetical protein